MNACYICHEPKNVRCCHNCHKDASKCETAHKCGENCPEHEPMTTADHIRSMSDEGLAMVIVEAQVVMAELMLKQFGIDFTFSAANKEEITRKAMDVIQQPWGER